MLNKKQVFNIVYAVALVGAITACFAILNEFLQVLQLNGVMVENLISYQKRDFWIPFLYYHTTFVLGAAAVILILFHFKFPQQIKLNLFLMITIAALFVMSMLAVPFFPPIAREGYSAKRWMGYSSYLITYTLRSSAMSLIPFLGIILGCNIINEKYPEKLAAEQTEEKSED